MTETEYNEIAAEIFESAMWTIKFTFAAENSTDAEKLEQIYKVVSGAFKHVEERRSQKCCLTKSKELRYNNSMTEDEYIEMVC